MDDDTFASEGEFQVNKLGELATSSGRPRYYIGDEVAPGAGAAALGNGSAGGGGGGGGTGASTNPGHGLDPNDEALQLFVKATALTEDGR